MTAARSAVLVLIASAGDAIGANDARARDDAAEESFCAAVDQARLMKTVRELVAIGARMGGTPSGDAAANYHVERFRADGQGLLEARIAADPELDAWQPTDFSARVTIGEETLDLKDGCLALGAPAIPACTLPIESAAGTGGTAARGEHALLTDQSGWRTDLERAGGRAKVLLLSCEARVDSSTPVMHQPRGIAVPTVTVSPRETKWLRERLGKGAKAMLAIHAEIFHARKAVLTAIADLPAAKADAPILLFCAHGDSDSGGPGADDNGSGDAVVHELAAVFSKLRKQDGVVLPFTLRFVVWGAEIHSSGAYFRAIQKDGSIARHLAVINFDQAGTGAERDCVYFEPDDWALNEPLVRAGLAIAGERVGKEGFWKEYTSNAALGGADSYVFAPNKGGKGDVPAITIFSAAFGEAETPKRTPGFPSKFADVDGKVLVDYSRVYHETGDRPENTIDLEPWDMVWVTKAAGLLTLRLAGSPESIRKLLSR